jgi:DNA-binding MarR family transcriptional regulator
MGKPKRFNLLEFLSKPRFLHEIVEHYKVSKKTAVFHLTEAMKSGQVLVSEAPAFQTIKDSTGKLKKLSGFLYVYQRSPILVGKDTRLSTLETNNFIPELGNNSRISFLSKPHGLSGKVTLERGSASPAVAEKVNPENRQAELRANSSLISKLSVSSAKVAPAKNTRSSRLPSSKQYSNSKLKPLLNVEKIRLFQALLKEPLPFLDIRNQFNVSRQTITRLVKRGLLIETWGSKGVGVRFKLTGKGKACLKELEEASKYELKIRELPLTRLKQRSVV